ncbi:hypothetical protein shim_09630 [Shimia sp. SK013]|uniref:sulfotransferase domain-containing protein n=1 Tax=Shimia sp. SK013 TaxID=1389006 RepID=UPI0006B45612|nr:sulfotransferase domain-containing protein [Shimia sp. SK013]KPA22676.1 hypothetical protein shim_09630 [Shimia sp. SK013]
MTTLTTAAAALWRGATYPLRSSTPVVHFSFHKNLTKYYNRVAETFAYATGRQRAHFNSNITTFAQAQPQLDMASVNNHFVDLAQLSNAPRASLFVRDPRDLVVSGYFYHKRGAEKWCHMVDPAPEDWRHVNSAVPPQMRQGESFTDCLNRLPLAEGLMAEIAFRTHHFDAMAQWLASPPSDLLILRYEDILGNEPAAFEALAAHYGFNRAERALWRRIAGGYAATKSLSKHVRNPSSGQWHDVFPPQVATAFNDSFSDLMEFSGYD